MSQTIVVFFIASLLVLQLVAAQELSDEDNEWIADRFQRIARAPKPKFIRFGRAGAKFIRFGRAGANSWESNYVPTGNEYYAKRGAKFIRFG
ncbi:unnamed protein product [Caenorhabditis bovis]|uniref:Uncharacterized protein n=1 Tax=Caenorhabditis bovis TaxID=2654633 RepID=A0A8S1EQM1_9PELO|nr:unnamed protein product [Caenorhabditis bovis]